MPVAVAFLWAWEMRVIQGPCNDASQRLQTSEEPGTGMPTVEVLGD